MSSPGLATISDLISNRLFASKRRMRLSPKTNIGVNTPPPAACGRGLSNSSDKADSPTIAAVSSVPGSPRDWKIVFAYRGAGSSDTVTFTYLRQPFSSVLGKKRSHVSSRSHTVEKQGRKTIGYALVCWSGSGLRHQTLEHPPQLWKNSNE